MIKYLLCTSYCRFYIFSDHDTFPLFQPSVTDETDQINKLNNDIDVYLLRRDKTRLFACFAHSFTVIQTHIS